MSISEELLSKISNTYEIQAISAQLIYDGVNKILQISDNTETFILKLFKKIKHSKSRISFERTILTHLNSHDINCIHVITPNANKEQTYEFNGKTYYGLMTRLCLGNQYSPHNKDMHCFLFGKALFRLHECPTESFTNPKFNTSNIHHLMRSLKKDNSSPAVQLRKTITNLFDNISLSLPPLAPPFEQCICHGDAWPGNALYFKDRCKLIDFEHARLADPALDIATFLWWLSGAELNESKKLTAWENFTQGYGESIEPRINEHTSTLIKTIQLRSLVFIHNNILLTEEILEHSLQQTSDLLHKTNFINQDPSLSSLWINLSKTNYPR
ncbi:phosphotransferase enzyme family protein [Pseudomonas izuensis]|uniref:Phosphotransferase n=1 Tax=Pseudomonas izuensis TaxID=2684212 RepID=A0ABM7RVA6_9PSED|nr:phosphotransferase [Pseudomonas izuensis]BCX69576.1 phosphotransferase [Pseudomonas izuensis]